MGSVAVVFPGQGSQRPGMARDFHRRYGAARDVFAEASDALDLDVAKLCFEDDPRLELTEYTQPAILTAEIAMFRSLEKDLGLRPARFGGHSLGEYAALCAAGAIPFADAVRVVRRRGALMQSAVPVGAGAMAAISARDIAATDLGDVLGGVAIDVANRNSRDQIVLAGLAPDLERACERLRDRPDVEITRLAVSAPFHSRHMRVIEPPLREALEAVAPRMFPARARAVVSNFLGGFHTGEGRDLVEGLTRQAGATVEWVSNMHALSRDADRVIEIGPSRPLRRFFETIGREVESVVSVAAAERALAS